ncbi:MAG: DUF2061 domain-containing protein [Xanthomonadaceae bacterium]|jgi:uncharacterized membrane protein|nr:DUF2061 domain-containing protein [Xanthomonadaceae bacterium]
MNKTFSFAIVHFSVAFLLGWLLTGNIWAGGILALIEPACNTVAFHLHEKIWIRVQQRKAARYVEQNTHLPA